MHDWATSMDSASSGVRVPSFREVERKSIMARARRFLESVVDACGRDLVGVSRNLMVGERTYHDGVKVGKWSSMDLRRLWP